MSTTGLGLVAVEKASPSRKRVIRLSLNQGVVGLAVMAAFTWWRGGEVLRVMSALGPEAPFLLALLAAFAAVLSLFKFRLTPAMFISPAGPAFLAMLPLLAPVLSSWIAVLAALLTRALSMAGIGPTKLSLDDPPVEYSRLFGLFGTYGLPMIVAGMCYEQLGGSFPLRDSTLSSAARIGCAEAAFLAVNAAVMARHGPALGYSLKSIVRMTATDWVIYLLALPYTVLVGYCWVELGFRGLVPLLATGVGGTIIVRNLAQTHAANKQLVQRLTSLSNLATIASPKCTREELFRAVYAECAKVIDVSHLDIALLDAVAGELVFEFEMRDGKSMPRSSLPLGEGLNSQVVLTRQPLLLRSNREEFRLGMRAVDDGVPTESWLGVPMISQDRVLGVLSVQSYPKNAFSQDDVVLLTAIASQAAGALESIKMLSGLLPICAWCKRVRDDRGYWRPIERFIHDRTEADFTHGICPECMSAVTPAGAAEGGPSGEPNGS